MKEFNEYQKLAIRTAKQQNQEYDLMHSAFGLSGEAGEFADAVKKCLVYGKPLDKANAFEELGDILWYVALACETLGVDMSEIAQQNISKLKLRYPEKYSDALAIERLDKVCKCEHIQLCDLNDKCMKAVL
jgi:NTP pyrophosphatase (non-canonical NTP hydrolase)